jgi:hypothetical protein
MGAPGAERVHKSDGVVGHVVQRVGNGRPFPRHHLRHQRARIWRCKASEMRRLADVAVVEPYDPKPLGRQPLAERLG